MNLHEHQAKDILKKYGAKIQEGIAVESVDAAIQAAKDLTASTGTQWHIVKAQVHAGGRGKGGGVKLAKNLDELKERASAILGMHLITPQTSKEGKLVNRILIAQDMYYPGPTETKEFYVSILLDRTKKQNVIIYSTEGGMDIEEVAEHHPEKLYKTWIDPQLGLMDFQCRQISFNLGLEGDAFKDMVKFIRSIYNAYMGSDASLLEINPCLKTSDNQIVAVDGKMSIDENAEYRQKEIAELRDLREEDPTEVEAGSYGLNYVKLDGNVGCMVNGAGLAMATMDIIKLSGGEPANFLDVGGTANAERVEKAFRIILKDPNVKAILINIFGGIVRCDRVAQGIVDAYNAMGNIQVPIIVRLQGTNAVEAKKIIDESGLKVKSVIQLKDAAEAVKEVLM
ncbi:MAG: ADP-forming succinate--CoA ligase subunit beta [Chitinophagales bacterium]|nr:ADP-forming succinate--CoA ligase subunit beta [Chitinophagales bacterium]